MKITHNTILTINSGSSSIKFSLYQMGQSETLILSGIIEGIGRKPTVLKIKEPRVREFLGITWIFMTITPVLKPFLNGSEKIAP